MFGQIDHNEMQLNNIGKIVQNEWDKYFVIRRELLRICQYIQNNPRNGVVIELIADRNIAWEKRMCYRENFR